MKNRFLSAALAAFGIMAATSNSANAQWMFGMNPNTIYTLHRVGIGLPTPQDQLHLSEEPTHLERPIMRLSRADLIQAGQLGIITDNPPYLSLMPGAGAGDMVLAAGLQQQSVVYDHDLIITNRYAGGKIRFGTATGPGADRERMVITSDGIIAMGDPPAPWTNELWKVWMAGPVQIGSPSYPGSLSLTPVDNSHWYHMDNRDGKFRITSGPLHATSWEPNPGPRGFIMESAYNGNTVFGTGLTDVALALSDCRVQVDGNVRVGLVHPLGSKPLQAGYGNFLRFSGGNPIDNFNSDNTDELWMARYNVARNASELRMAIADDVLSEYQNNWDSFVIGTTESGWTDKFRFRSDGTAFKPGGGTWSVLSDARIKENVQPFTDGLNVVRAINPVWFSYQQRYLPENHQYVGVIAQEMQKIAPYTISNTTINVPGTQEQMDVLSYDPNAVTYIALNAIKELDAKVTELEALRAENEQMKQRIAALEAQNGSSGNSTAPSVNIQEEIILEQNSPNPFGESTTIMYYIPATVTGAVEIVVADAAGSKVLQRHPATVNTPGQVTVSAKGLNKGVYVYGISVNGQIIKSKKMMVIR